MPKGISGLTLDLPLVEIRVDSLFVRETFLACLIEPLPEKLSVLVGNDLVFEEAPLNIGLVTRAQSRLIADEDRPPAVQTETQDVEKVSLPSISVLKILHDDELVGLRLFDSDCNSTGDVQNFVSRIDIILLQRAKNSLTNMFVLSENTNMFVLSENIFDSRWKEKLCFFEWRFDWALVIK